MPTHPGTLCLQLYLHVFLLTLHTAAHLIMSTDSLAMSGHDVKSLLWNLTMSFIFLCPLPLYSGHLNLNQVLLAILVLYFFSYMKSPIGWKRPHPYSDDPANRLPKKK